MLMPVLNPSLLRIGSYAAFFSLLFVGPLAYALVWVSPTIEERIEYRYTPKRGAWLKWFQVDVHYNARMVNVATGASLDSYATVPVGTRIRFEPIPHVSSDISWKGAGGRYDTPYGEWVENAGNFDPRNICTEQNFVGAWDDDAVYARLSIDPPEKDVSVAGTSLSCDPVSSDGSRTCTAVRAGPASATVDFNPTFGHFYLGVNDWHQVGRKHVTACQYDSGIAVYKSSTTVPYTLQVPIQSIEFFLNVIDEPNAAPSAPAVSEGGSCLVDSPYTISMSATDPDNHPVRYLVDWNNDGVADQIVRPTEYVSSGSVQTASRTFTTEGGKTIRVLAEDSRGALSTWRTHTVTCATLPDQSEENRSGDNGGDNNDEERHGYIPGAATLSLRAIPSLVRPGGQTTIRWEASGVSSCSIRGSNGDMFPARGETLAIPGQALSSPIVQQTTYTLSCVEEATGSTERASATVNILPVFQEN